MNTLIILTFALGYALIAFEHKVHINKAASALLTGVLCWTFLILGSPGPEPIVHSLVEHLGDISQILIFLLGAMTIVELIDAHGGFEVITRRITTNRKSVLLWIMAVLTFFLSAVLDNLTTTIVMVTLSRKLIQDKKVRLLFISMIVIAANAGGAWTPIGDVTTTMLWIGGQISTLNIMQALILPSLVCMLVPLMIVARQVRGTLEVKQEKEDKQIPAFEKNLVFGLGISALIFVPVFKTWTHLPPFMGIMLGLGALWAVTELLHKKKESENKITVAHALRKVDIPSILFFLGILIAVSALQTNGMLAQLATAMDQSIGNINVIGVALGVLSAIIDNVPLVSAAMGMYSLETYPMDHKFWELIAYCAGTGGSILIIGSAAGVAAMGLEKIDFFWYLKKISWLALLGYLGGAATYLLMH